MAEDKRTVHIPPRTEMRSDYASRQASVGMPSMPMSGMDADAFVPGRRAGSGQGVRYIPEKPDKKLDPQGGNTGQIRMPESTKSTVPGTTGTDDGEGMDIGSDFQKLPDLDSFEQGPFKRTTELPPVRKPFDLPKIEPPARKPRRYEFDLPDITLPEPDDDLDLEL